MGVKHEAFLDLEAALEARLMRSWDHSWLLLSREIGFAVDDGDFDRAHSLVETLTLKPMVDKVQTYLTTIGKASLLLGASRLGRPDRSSVYKNPPMDLLAKAKQQFSDIVSINATTALRQRAHLYLDRYESEQAAGIEKARQLKAPAKGLRTTIAQQGRSLINIAASVYVSRQSTAGMLIEATNRSIQYYRVSEVLDDRTCPVCQRMHNQRFPVQDGLSHVMGILSVNDPATLRQMAPWPSQSKANVKAIQAMSTAGMIEAGIHLPPYHARCRGIVVPDGGGDLVDLAGGILGGVAAGMAIQITPENAGDQLFGDRSEIDADAEDLFSEGAVSWRYGERPVDPTPDSLFLVGVAAGAASNKEDPDLPLE